LEAACAYDLAQIALYGHTVQAIKLNFAAETYTQQQVDSMAALIWQRRPAWQAAAERLQTTVTVQDVAAMQAAEAAAGETASAALANSPTAAAQLAGATTDAMAVYWEKRSRRNPWLVIVQVFGSQFRKGFRSRLEACCAADLARLAIHGRAAALKVRLNLPVATYTQQQVAAWRELLQLQPSWDAATPDPVLHTPEGSDALQLATEVLSATVAAAGLGETEPAMLQKLRDSRLDSRGVGVRLYYNTDGSLLWVLTIDRQGQSISKAFGTQLEAAVAFDLTQLALYGAAACQSLTFQARTYQPEQVAAWAQLLQHGSLAGSWLRQMLSQQ
jgi:hypothetical protein